MRWPPARTSSSPPPSARSMASRETSRTTWSSRPISSIRSTAFPSSACTEKCAGPMPMRHGLTMGELGHWFINQLQLDVDYRVIDMQGWQPDAAPGFGWPLHERTWINPSPNAPNLWMARAYAGTGMLEGTTLSEGRGTTRPLEIFGAPDIDAKAIIAAMQASAPHSPAGCKPPETWFEPTFHKHAGKLCHGVQIHMEDPAHYDHAAFQPWRLQTLAFKALRRLPPD